MRVGLFRVVVASALVACGGRTLIDGGDAGGAGSTAGPGDSGATGASSDGQATGGGSSNGATSGGMSVTSDANPTDGTGATGTSAGPQQPCVLEPAGEPIELIDHVETSHAVDLVVLDGGAPGRDATLAVHAKSQYEGVVGANSRLWRARLGPTWPDVELDAGPTRLTTSSYTAGRLEPAFGNLHELGFAWLGDIDGALNVGMFRTFDVDAWQEGPIVRFDEDAGTVRSLAPGMSVVDDAYAGSGYAIAYGGHFPDEAVPWKAFLSVIDSDGGATHVTRNEIGWGLNRLPRVATAWTGSRYLVVAAFPDPCVDGDLWCREHSVVVGYMLPTGQINIAWVYPANDPRAELWYPRMRTDHSTMWLTWREETKSAVGGPSTYEIRVVAFGPNEIPVGDPVTVDVNEVLSGGAIVHPFQDGALAVWVEDHGVDIDGELVVQRLDGRAALVGPQLRVPSAEPYGWPLPSIAVLDEPRGVFIAWNAYRDDPDSPYWSQSVYALRFDCRL